MPKKCIYCKTDIPHESVIDFCDKCGRGVWGEKFFEHIKKSMKEADEKGDLSFNSGHIDTGIKAR
ncbi:MAG: hypothetical protein AABW81_02660 [Nanoarchaeota archaeon]